MTQDARSIHGTQRSVSAAVNLRFKASINHFKRLLLQDAHVPGKAQVSAVFEELEAISTRLAPASLLKNPRFDLVAWVGLRLTHRSWQAWFTDGVKMPKVQRQLMLDDVASRALRWTTPNDGIQRTLPEHFYVDLMGGGLLRFLLAPTDSRDVIGVLRSRAASYRPMSAWHLHFDALELRAHSENFAGVPWEEIVRIGAGRVMEVLHELWRPRDGRIYAALSSDTRRQWDSASAEERIAIRERFSRFRPGRYEACMQEGASPSWHVVGVGADVHPVHAHRLLFSIGADTEFLQGDRLSAWALDLATAGLASHALAWTDRYRLFGRQVNEERVFLAAIDALMLTAPSVGPENETVTDREARHFVEIERELSAAMDCCASDWAHGGMTGLAGARASYSNELRELGISIGDVEQVSRVAQRRRPLEYIG
jgi:hypothetical protein